MRLLLIRHGKPNVGPEVCYGSSDLEVAAAEHDRVAAALLPNLPRQTTIHTSPLRRCRELAARLSAALAAPLIEDARLAEMHFGEWEMRAWDQIGRAEVDLWAADPLHFCPGNGESVLIFARRVQAFYLDLQAANTERAIVVCHAGTMRVLAECNGSATLEEIAARVSGAARTIAYGALVALDCERL
jgi:alpha-ribazole phosphatase